MSVSTVTTGGQQWSLRIGPNWGVSVSIWCSRSLQQVTSGCSVNEEFNPPNQLERSDLMGGGRKLLLSKSFPPKCFSAVRNKNIGQVKFDLKL